MVARSLSGGQTTGSWFGNLAPVPMNEDLDDHDVWSMTRRRARAKVHDHRELLPGGGEEGLDDDSDQGAGRHEQQGTWPGIAALALRRHGGDREPREERQPGRLYATPGQ